LWVVFSVLEARVFFFFFCMEDGSFCHYLLCFVDDNSRSLLDRATDFRLFNA